MKTILCILLITLIGSPTSNAGLALTQAGKAQVPILTQAGATAPELRAARELAATLKTITGADFEVREASGGAPAQAILIGAGPVAREKFPEVPFDQLGQEEIVMKTSGDWLLLAGGRPRGTLYAVSYFLQRECQVRWWTPWATRMPRNESLVLGELNVRYQPPFESRDPFWYLAFDGDWAVRNFSNSQSARLTDEMGGKIAYKGFVHTFYPLVPPEKYFKEHPEWYSYRKGKRTTDHAQLCLASPELRDFVVQRVREWLKESPAARIISVSQNDWYGACECPGCKAIDDAEGGPAGSMLSFVNYVAEKIGPEFPQVAIDTLAYQYTRKAPKNLKPRPNVIVRLCSIECNFAVPLDAPANAAFARDIQDWSRISDRLYIWDYTTDFAHYLQPHPNWYSLGPNVRFFQQHHVRGLFEQGAYQSQGAEMAELRAWVLAQLLWDPRLDDRALIREFLEGYYGPAAQPIADYMNLMQEAARGHNLTCFSPSDVPFLKFKTLAQAEAIWRRAEAAVESNPDLAWRVRLGHLPVRYAWLVRWTQLRDECRKLEAQWPLDSSRKAVAREFLETATGPGPAGWSKITHLNESGLTPEKFLERFAKDPEEKKP